MLRTRSIGMGRAFAIYGAGLLAGVQGALYLFDLSDDGVADWRSGGIALVFLGLGLAFLIRTFRSS
jgi:hypothetical protein